MNKCRTFSTRGQLRVFPAKSRATKKQKTTIFHAVSISVNIKHLVSAHQAQRARALILIYPETGGVEAQPNQASIKKKKRKRQKER